NGGTDSDPAAAVSVWDSEYKIHNKQIETAATTSTQERCQSIIHTELRQLRAMVEELKRQRQGALGIHGGHIGPYNTGTTSVYRKIFTNVGNAYSSNTGIFVRPVRGVYVFGFSAFNHASAHTTAISVYYNGQTIFSIHDEKSGSTDDSSFNSASILLEEGDQVYMRLLANMRVYEDHLIYNTFSGHLLYPIMGGLTLTLVLLCLSGTLSEDAGEDNLNDIMVQIQPEQGRNIENEYKTHNQQVKTASTTTTTQSGCEPTIHTVMRELGAMEERLGATVRSLEGMRNRLEASERPNRPQVAFSATLGISGTIGPVSNEITLVFRRVLSNIGNAYNPTTGIFTAPVRGLYHFTFTAFDWGWSTTGASLCHNGQRMVSVYDEKEGGSSESSSNSATFLLQVGEQVYVALWSDGRRISDNGNHYSSFNGFLLFPM
ncbi:unnamed protein product, partial [Coregonus sp. 'balchen']